MWGIPEFNLGYEFPIMYPSRESLEGNRYQVEPILIETIVRSLSFNLEENYCKCDTNKKEYAPITCRQARSLVAVDA